MSYATTAFRRRPSPSRQPVAYLRSIYSVRERSRQIMQRALTDTLHHFDVDMSQLDSVADYIANTIQRDFAPMYAHIPPHGRWQHFEVGGVPRVAHLLQAWDCDAHEATRRLMDLFLVSVLLDAGAGNTWVYSSAEGRRYGRSEGLAVASLEIFEKGLFSSDEGVKCRVDGRALRSLSVDAVAAGLQVSEQNPMDGLEGRAGVLRRLGSALENERYFGADGRPGNMLDYLLAHPTTTYESGRTIVELPTFWDCLMDGLNPIWPPSRTQLEGQALGDAWPVSTLIADRPPAHPRPTGQDGGPHAQDPNPRSIMPFHKLTQWLCYSLMPPQTLLLSIHFADADLLTGLAEYRNGGLLTDLGLLNLKPADYRRGLAAATGDVERVPTFDVDDGAIVEWRGCTIGFLDLLIPLVNGRLGMTGGEGREPLELAQVLEAGTWKGGREVAAEKRPRTKGPPIAVRSDGTVF